jgi:hypothetical protein
MLPATPSGILPATPSGAPSARMPVAPVPVIRTSWRPLVIAVLALALGGGGAYFYVHILRDPTLPEPAPLPAALPIAVVDAAPADTQPIDAAPIDAAPIDAAPIDAAPIDAAPIDAALVHVGQPGHPAQPERHPANASSGRPSGPPGFITIDSSPVYAVIYIDGKNYGETPLANLALPPGRHSVHAVAPSGATRDVRITIESGKVTPASRIEW